MKPLGTRPFRNGVTFDPSEDHDDHYADRDGQRVCELHAGTGRGPFTSPRPTVVALLASEATPDVTASMAGKAS